jgi:hypothetical protein
VRGFLRAVGTASWRRRRAAVVASCWKHARAGRWGWAEGEAQHRKGSVAVVVVGGAGAGLVGDGLEVPLLRAAGGTGLT